MLRTTASVKAADSAIASSGKVSWSSSDENVAKVDENGNITVTGEGSAVITAAFGKASAQLTVNGSSDDKKDSDSGGTGNKSDADTDSGGRNADDGSAVQEPDASDKPAGSITNPVPSKVISAGDIGGVQNWRVYEMSSDAAPLTQQQEENRMLPVMGGAAAGLLCAGIIGRALRFRRDLNGRSAAGHDIKSQKQ